MGNNERLLNTFIKQVCVFVKTIQRTKRKWSKTNMQMSWTETYAKGFFFKRAVLEREQTEWGKGGVTIKKINCILSPINMNRLTCFFTRTDEANFSQNFPSKLIVIIDITVLRTTFLMYIRIGIFQQMHRGEHFLVGQGRLVYDRGWLSKSVVAFVVTTEAEVKIFRRR